MLLGQESNSNLNNQYSLQFGQGGSEINFFPYLDLFEFHEYA